MKSKPPTRLEEKNVTELIFYKRLRNNGSRASGDGMKIMYIVSDETCGEKKRA